MGVKINVENLDGFKNMLSILRKILQDEKIDKKIRQAYYNKLKDIMEEW